MDANVTRPSEDYHAEVRITPEALKSLELGKKDEVYVKQTTTSKGRIWEIKSNKPEGVIRSVHQLFTKAIAAATGKRVDYQAGNSPEMEKTFSQAYENRLRSDLNLINPDKVDSTKGNSISERQKPLLEDQPLFQSISWITEKNGKVALTIATPATATSAESDKAVAGSEASISKPADGSETKTTPSLLDAQAKAKRDRIKANWARAFDAAKKVGAGAAEAERAGLKPKVLNEGYWREAISGGAIYGGSDHDIFEEWKNSDTKLNYMAWRELQHPELKAVDTQVAYLDANQRKEYAVSFENGKAMYKGMEMDSFHESTISGAGNMIFVIGPDKTLYAGSHVVGKFHHSSFLAGGVIVGAGELKCDRGKITEISNKSGHYKPNKDEMVTTLTILSEKGVDLSNVKLRFLLKQGDLVFSAKDYLDSKGECLPSSYGSAKIEKDGNSIRIVDQSPRAPSDEAAIKTLQNLSENGVDLSNSSYTVTTMWGKTTYNAAEFLNEQAKTVPLSMEKVGIARNQDGHYVITDNSLVGQENLNTFLISKGVNPATTTYKSAASEAINESKESIQNAFAAIINAYTMPGSQQREAVVDIRENYATIIGKLSTSRELLGLNKPTLSSTEAEYKKMFDDIEQAARNIPVQLQGLAHAQHADMSKIGQNAQSTPVAGHLLDELRTTENKFYNTMKEIHHINNGLKRLDPNAHPGIKELSICLDKFQQLEDFSGKFSQLLNTEAGKEPGKVADFILSADPRPLMEARNNYLEMQTILDKGGPELSKLLDSLRSEDQQLTFMQISSAPFQRTGRIGDLLKQLTKEETPPRIGNSDIMTIIQAAQTRISAINRYQEAACIKTV